MRCTHDPTTPTRFDRLSDQLFESLAMVSIALICLVLIDGCFAPSQRNPMVFGTVRVALADSRDGVWTWSQHQRAMLDPYLNVTCDATGPDWILVNEFADADVIVRATNDMLDGACGLYTTGDSEVRVNTACASGDDAMRRAVGHELLHWYTDHWFHWVGHLCSWPVNVPPPAGCHPTILCTDCLLSPGLRDPDLTGPTFDEAYVPPIADPEPAEQDLQLIAHCESAHACVP